MTCPWSSFPVVTGSWRTLLPSSSKTTDLPSLKLKDDGLAIPCRYRILGDGDDTPWRCLLLLRLLWLEEGDVTTHLRLQVLVLVDDGHLYRHRRFGAVRCGDDLPQHSLISMVRDCLHRYL